MGHNTSEFEIKNSEGETRPIAGQTSGTIGNTIPVPSTPDKIIEEIFIQNDAPLIDGTQLGLEAVLTGPNKDSEIQVSIDGGVSFRTIYAGQGFNFDTRTNKQVLVKSNVANCPFSAIVKFEKFDEVS